MDRSKMDYWLYLEPYTFLFHNNEKFLIYNTLNGMYVDCTPYASAYKMLDELYHSDKNYGVAVGMEMLNDDNFMSFVCEIRNTFSGDLAKNTTDVSPFIFKPLLRIYSRPGDLRVKQENLLGLNSLLYLHEVTFFMENTCGEKCEGCNRYYKQFPHCTKTEKQQLTLDDYENIISQLELCQLDKVRLIVGEHVETVLFDELMNRFSHSPLKKEVVLHSSFYSESTVEKLIHAGFSIQIMMHFPLDKEEIMPWLNLCVPANLTFIFVVTNEEELLLLDQLDIPSEINRNLVPYYDGMNVSFFEKYVYSEWDDLIGGNPISKQTIFRRQVLNENFFGKLYVFPDGEVYSNVNFPPLGNLTKQKLTEIVFQEISNSSSWLLTRNQGACGQCINKQLCPSPSNYEVVMNKFDLCHIKIK